MNPKRLVDTKTAAKHAPWTKSTFARLASMGKIKGCYKVRGRLVFDLDEMLEWITSDKQFTETNSQLIK